MPKVAPIEERQRNKRPWAEQDNTLRGPWTFLTKEKVQCICEGGRCCTREDPAKQKGGNAIPGLHSSWVGDKILAMARPWQHSIARFNLVDAFLQHNIGMILNLQEVGEHEGCGPGNLKSSGFTYDPNAFMAARIGFYNFSWQDMGVPTLACMMDIVQVMEFVTAIEGRKIAVHCHAGLGRTGLAIACFYVFINQFDAKTAIATVRQYRPGALQTKHQVLFVSVFEQYISYLSCIFPSSKHLQLHQQHHQPQQLQDKQHQHQQQQQQQSASTSASSDGHWYISMPHPLRVHPTTASTSYSLLLQKPVDVKESNGARTETYRSGLVIVRPLAAQTTEQQAAPSTSGRVSHHHEQDERLPWNRHLEIVPSVFNKHWTPSPPPTYEAALQRQRHLLHGPERRAFLHLHQFAKEAVFSIMAAAKAHVASATQGQGHTEAGQGSASGSGRFSASSPSGLMNTGSGRVSGHLSSMSPQPSHQPATSASQQAAPCTTSFAHAVAACISMHAGGQRTLDPTTLSAFSQSPPYRPFVGKKADVQAIQASLSSLTHAANIRQFSTLAAAPLLVLLMALESFFNAFDPSQPSLTTAGLQHIAISYFQLPMEVSDAPEPLQFQEALQVLLQLPAPDQELLLLFAAMLRHIACASPVQGVEAPMVVIARWVLRLLLGQLATDAAAEEACLSFLWYLLRNDIAFASLIICKQWRLERRNYVGITVPSIPGSGAAIPATSTGSTGSAGTWPSMTAGATFSSSSLQQQPLQQSVSGSLKAGHATAVLSNPRPQRMSTMSVNSVNSGEGPAPITAAGTGAVSGKALELARDPAGICESAPVLEPSPLAPQAARTLANNMLNGVSLPPLQRMDAPLPGLRSGRTSAVGSPTGSHRGAHHEIPDVSPGSGAPFSKAALLGLPTALMPLPHASNVVVHDVWI